MKDTTFDNLQSLKNELGWHEFGCECVDESQYLLRKMMELIKLLQEDAKNGI